MDYSQMIPTPGNPVGVEQIKQALPHREPFLWLTRIVEFEPGVRVVAELDIDPSWDIFKGHFPGQPVFPGVLQMEALAQAAGYAVLADPANQGKVGFLGSMDKCKFRRQVLPGETLTLIAEPIKAGRRSARFAVKAMVGEELASEAEQFYVMAKESE